MADTLSPAEKGKSVAAEHAATYIRSGMKVGLGTGSTAEWLVRAVGRMVQSGALDIQAVPTSTRTATLAREVGIDVITLDQAGWLDLTIDGTDEYDPALTLIKGGGGAHLQEKVVAQASNRMIVIADPSKTVANLGAFPLPVEVLQFGAQASRTLVTQALGDLGYRDKVLSQRMAGDAPFVSDEGNFIFDLHLGRITDAAALSAALNQIPGVVENGLFIDICDLVIVGHPDGRVTLTDTEHGERDVAS